MDQRQFIQWLESDQKLPASAIDPLRRLTKEYPYFQSAHALLAKAMADNHDLLYDKHLKIAAAHCADRQSLYHLIHRKPSSVFISSAAKEVHPSPFVLEEKIEAPEVKTTVPETEPVQPLVVEAPAEQVPFEAYVFTPPPVQETPEVKSSAPEDPHEVIRRRLAEILGSPVEIKEIKSAPVKEEKASVEIDYTSEERPQTFIPSLSKQNVAPETTTVKEEPVQPLKTETKHEISEPEVVALKEEVVSPADASTSSELTTPEERITEATKTVVDEVDTLQLEYALETSILSSIEQLPLLEKQPVKEEETGKSAAQEETGSFLHWLKNLPVSGFGQVEEVHADEPDKPEADAPDFSAPTQSKSEEDRGRDALIDRFIATEPRIVPSKAEFYSPATQAKRSVTDNEDLVSETLAKIYLLQGHPLKARKCYEKLSLLQPEKKTYFAALIKEIDLQINNSENQDL